VLVVSISPLSTILIFYFGIVPTVWYVFLFILLFLNYWLVDFFIICYVFYVLFMNITIIYINLSMEIW